MLKIALDFAFCLQDLERKCATEQYPGGHREILPNMKKETHSSFHLNSSRSDSGLPDELGHPPQACPVPCLYAEEGLEILFLPLVRGWFCNPYFLLWLSMEVFFSKFDPEGMTEKMVGDGGVLVLLVHFAFKKKCKFLLSGFTFSLSFTSAGIVWKKCKIQPSV